MTKDNLHFDVQDRLRTGIRKVARAVGSTMGTAGINVLIEAIESPGHLNTNDGYTIANSIHLADPIENMARNLLLEAINRANKLSGDGSSTTCVLTEAIIDVGAAYREKHHPMAIKRSLEECLPLIEAELNKQSRPVTVDDVHQVATISAEDETIGKRIGDIYKEIGPKGVIYWDISKTGEDYHTIGQGITVEGATYISPYMCDVAENGATTNIVTLTSPHILLTKQKISVAAELNSIASALNDDDIRELVVFCDEFDPLVIPDLLRTRLEKGFRIVLVKMPVLWKDLWFEDLAKVSGATVIDPIAGLPLKSATKEHLGKLGNILVTKEAAYLDGIKDVSEHIAALGLEDTDDSNLRASRLNTKTARYFVGAHSDSALSYRRLKVEDAISASYQALNGGIVAGGGVALRNVSTLMPDTVGGQILNKALLAPVVQITTNAGLDGIDLCEGSKGLDTRTKAVVDMFEAGIIDPKNVVLNAVRNALSVASQVLTAPTAITLPREEHVSQGNLITR